MKPDPVPSPVAQEFLKMPAFAERITEEYVYIAETDHLIIKDIPNRAT